MYQTYAAGIICLFFLCKCVMMYEIAMSTATYKRESFISNGRNYTY